MEGQTVNTKQLPTEPLSNNTITQICLNTNNVAFGKLCASSSIFWNSTNFIKSVILLFSATLNWHLRQDVTKTSIAN